jgi:hypothetical protein
VLVHKLELNKMKQSYFIFFYLQVDLIEIILGKCQLKSSILSKKLNNIYSFKIIIIGIFTFIFCSNK